jgi:hypothetical protein
VTTLEREIQEENKRMPVVFLLLVMVMLLAFTLFKTSLMICCIVDGITLEEREKARERVRATSRLGRGTDYTAIQ